jgi:hypothetical protein
MEVRWRAAHAAFGAPVIEPDKGSLMGKEVGVQTRCSSVEGAGQLRRRRRVNACLNELGLMAHAPAGGDLTGDRDIGVPCKPPTGCIRSAVGHRVAVRAPVRKLEAQASSAGCASAWRFDRAREPAADSRVGSDANSAKDLRAKSIKGGLRSPFVPASGHLAGLLEPEILANR